MVTRISKPKILVFGSFDGLHAGHLSFLSQASGLGELYISVASDESVTFRKGKAPLYTQSKRIQSLKKLKIAKLIIPGDKTPRAWTPIHKVHPDIIAIGYDQVALKKELLKIKKDFGFSIKTMKSFKPKKLHSSILNKAQ